MVRPHDRARQGIRERAMQDHDLMTGPPNSGRPSWLTALLLGGAEQVIQVAEKIDHLLEASSPYLIARCALPAGVLSWMADRPQNVHYGDDAYWRE